MFDRDVGIYIRGVSEKIHGTPAQAAKKAKDHNIDFVALLVIWQYADKTYMSNGRDLSLLRKYIEAFNKQDVETCIWGYPWAGKHTEYVDRMSEVINTVGRHNIATVIHDPELGMKWGKNGLSQFATEASAKYIVDHMSDDGMDQVTTSFGIPGGHKLPWKVFSSETYAGSPQFYTAEPKDIDRGIKQWDQLGWDCIMPSVPLYGKKSGANLHDYLSNFFDLSTDVDGLIFWSWRQSSPDEWRIMQRWSNWMKERTCT